MSASAGSYKLRIPTEVAELIRSLHPTIKRKVRIALKTIVRAPTSGKPLEEELAGLRSYRVGKFRIVYRIGDDRTIDIVAVGPRKYIYEETYWKVIQAHKSTS